MSDNRNRVLTFAELTDSAGALVWLEDNDGDYEPCARARKAEQVAYMCNLSLLDEPCAHARKAMRWERESHRMYFDDGRAWYADYTYGETWRCWLRQPTPGEMANTPWEGNDA